MILPDLNLLLYAHNPTAREHAVAMAWWEDALNGSELIGLPHEVLFGFVRIATHPRLGRAAVELGAAKVVVELWLSLSHVRVLLPTSNHFERVLDLCRRAGGGGPLLSDAILAAYAIEYRATLCSNDSDFSRFADLNWVNPLRPR